MLWACQEGQLSVCQWLFKVGAAADITKVSDYGFTPMLAACREGHLSVCKWLFEVGAAGDITKTNNSGFTPMHGACMVGHLSVCQWLFEVGAAGDITKTADHGFTPMHFACRNGHLSVCEWLFEVGAEPDIDNPDIDTPLYLACAKGHQSVCKFLILSGAKIPSIKDCNGSESCRNDIRSWARSVINVNNLFRSLVILGTYSENISESNILNTLLKKRPGSDNLWKLSKDIIMHIADFAGVLNYKKYQIVINLVDLLN
jgi:ankyrin repeat protein